MKRPVITTELILDTAKEFAARQSWTDEQAADLADVYSRHDDGYQLAKKLESTHCWDISVEGVETLDCFDNDVRSRHREVCAEWAKSNNIQPPHPIGTVTTRGEITGVSEYEPATYLIKEHGETNDSRRLLVKFEDAIPQPQPI